MGGKGRLRLLLITVVELVIFLDTTVLNVALPEIGRHFDLGEAGLGWVTNAYLLAFGGFMLLGGRAADLYGPRRMFGIGLSVFTIASALAGFASTAWLLIGARAVQGVGAAVVIPAQLALLTAAFTEPAARRRAFGVWSAMGAAGAAIGTAVGGPLTDTYGWPSIFLINLPVGVLALALLRSLPADPPATERADGRLDVPGALTGTAALLIIGYSIGAWGDPGTRVLAWALLGIGVALFAGFLVIEKRSSHPLMPLRLFAIRQVSGSSAVNALVGAAHVPAFALLALYLQNTQGYSPTLSGLAVLPVAVVNIVVSRTLIPFALARIGPRGVLAAGMALQAAALGWFARLPEHGSYVTDVLPAAIVFGIGLPAAFVGVTVPAVTAVGDADRGIAAGVVNTAQRVGSGIGVTAVLLLAQTVTEKSTSSHSFVDGIRAGFAAAAMLALLGCLLTVLVLRVPRTDPVAEPGATAPSAIR
ncbi:MFS transporter [Nocardia sp. NBC_00508]|uniref:MFS transporter n=1 Tax=Nocardia sp. NBC_00508 TaxID=2975992 RepID=UPI002E81437C|nr:MFS transporter [Nocardia sp. NBC_00508]WUD64708.1 MFS transporter [Nocardia sp. NBC_00508]